MRIEKAIYTLGFLSLLSAGAPQKQFPEWRGSNNLLLYGLWEATPIVAIGNVKNVTKFGQQTVDHLPWPVTQDLHKLYWCQGDFDSIAIIKGALDAKKKYVWASVNPGCRLFYRDSHDSKRVTRVWFLREEGEFLRPTFDGGAALFYGFFQRWNYAPDLAPQQKLGVLFLTPNANSDSLAEFASNIWGVADVACSLLGKTECVERIRALAKLGDRSLRVAACEYLKAQQNKTCEIPQ